MYVSAIYFIEQYLKEVVEERRIFLFVVRMVFKKGNFALKLKRFATYHF